MSEAVAKVPLSMAYVWECPNCGTENWQRAVVQALTDEETKEAMVALGEIEEWQDPHPDLCGQMWGMPNKVVCKHCVGEWETIGEDSGDEDCEDDE